MASEATARKFFTASAFAVVGASSNTAKFGHKVFAWYLAYNLPVTPINPSAGHVTVQGKDYPAVPNLTALPNPKETAVSIITHPAITIDVLKEANRVGVPSIWLQPGTWDDAVLAFANEKGNFENVVYGDGGRGGEGWCVLVDGERVAKAAGKL
ncbi:CoA binding domain-containing protein [Emericellopsis atlantica]|uniref:CoA binding domain-containing protein n=1 Tax=Emericellopsis atlantica TaxID=2614577 RepID=A0A9P7ZX42_9HYPO|nr:CoA binding domain-containing protein [Emericellopsis atlantica]KAG9259161.1 CoA binding domain-containing protein [Emericellopsis atlantica]